MKFKFKVNIMEFERGWGSRIDEVKSFNSYEEAVAFIKDFNSLNTDITVPDWYMIAEAANFKLLEQ